MNEKGCGRRLLFPNGCNILEFDWQDETVTSQIGNGCLQLAAKFGVVKKKGKVYDFSVCVCVCVRERERERESMKLLQQFYKTGHELVPPGVTPLLALELLH
jgi:hypothetical protein